MNGKEIRVLFLEEKQMASLLDGFGRILIDIIVLGRKRKMCIVFGKKINNVIA